MSEFQALFESAVIGGREDRLVLADWLDEHDEPHQADALRGETPTIDLPLVGEHTMRFAWVPPGKSWLGGRRGRPGGKPFTLEKPLWCGIYPVTQAEWEAVMGYNPSSFGNKPTHPVEEVSWEDVREFLERINRKLGSRYLFDLPTEAEWEYICRGGPITKEESKYDFYFAKSKTDLTPVREIDNEPSSHQANFNGEYPAGPAKVGPNLQRTSPVGSYVPNPLGIYDMHGNVNEWTKSWYDVGRFVHRGGNWRERAPDCSAAFRFWDYPNARYDWLGFRVVAVPLY